MNKILICGSTSFVANGFVTLLQKESYEWDTFSRGVKPSRKGNMVRGKYLEIHTNPKLLSEYDIVVNFAVLKDESIEDNVKYLQSLVKMCKEHKVKKLIHFSSIMVYSRKNKVVNEQTPIDSSETTIMRGYGQIKIVTDEYLTSVMNNVPFEIIRVRPGFVLAPGMACPFIKKIGPVSIILGNKNSTLPIVRREDIHKALVCIINIEKNLPVYLFYPNDGMTKYRFAKKIVGGIVFTIPKWLFCDIPYLMAKIHLIPGAFYSRFEGMFTSIKYSSEQTENILKIKFE